MAASPKPSKHLRLVEERLASEPVLDSGNAVQDRGAEAGSIPPPQGVAAEISSASGPLAELPDAELVALAVQGNRKAFEVLYRRHVSFALHLAIRVEGSSRDAEDVVHDAFVKAFERLDELSDRAAFRAWLGSILVRAVRSRMRRARLLHTLGLLRAGDAVDLDAVASTDASPAARAQIAQVYALLRTLSVDDRISWVLRAVEGHDLETVARLTSCSLATVKRRIGRVQHFLDDHFVDPHHKEESS